MDWATLAQLAGNVAGDIASEGDRKEANRLMREALARFDNIPEPVLEQIIAEQLGPTEMESLKADPALRGAEMDALRRLAQVADEGGLTLEDKANLADIERDAQSLEQSGQAAIRDRMRATGRGGSGSELAMMMQAGQSAADRAGRQGLQVAGMAQKRALQAMIQRGEMAGQMGARDFAQRAAAAQAADLRNRFNASSREKASYYNAGLPQQQYENAMRRASARLNPSQAAAAFANQNANNTRDKWATYGAAGAEWLKEDPNSPEAIRRRAEAEADADLAYYNKTGYRRNSGRHEDDK